MTLLQALILGIVQGLTEFFPISSSAHLRIVKTLLGLPEGESFLYFDLLCHAGTLIALIWTLRKEVLEILLSPKKIALYSLAILPLVPAYFFLKPVRIAASDPALLSYFLWITAALLFVASRKSAPASPPSKSLPQVVGIGCMQALALIPGISRSGATITAARLFGWDWIEAARFSFLLAIPTVLGAEALESYKLWQGTSEASGAVSPICYTAGFTASLAIGFIGVRFMFQIYEKGWVRPFAWYCLGAGLFAWFLFHF